MSDGRPGSTRPALVASYHEYRTPAGDSVHVTPVGDHNGVPIFDVEVIHDGNLVVYHEDVTGWYVQTLRDKHGWVSE